MKSEEVSKLAGDIRDVDHVDTVINLMDILDPSVPKELLPDIVQQSLSNPDASMIVVFFDSSTSSEETLNAVSDIRGIINKTTYIQAWGHWPRELWRLRREQLMQ